MREPVVFLSPESGGLNEVQASDIGAPRRLNGHLIELSVLLNHGGDDAKECFVTWKHTGATSECVTLQETL